MALKPYLKDLPPLLILRCLNKPRAPTLLVWGHYRKECSNNKVFLLVYLITDAYQHYI